MALQPKLMDRQFLTRLRQNIIIYDRESDTEMILACTHKKKSIIPHAYYRFTPIFFHVIKVPAKHVP